MQKQWQLLEKESGRVILEHLEMANTYWSRFRGLMFRRKLETNSGIWIIPCQSIHTMWVRFPLDLHFIDRNGVVIQSKKDVKPWRIAFAPKGTHSVLETAVGSVSLPKGTSLQSQAVEIEQ